MSFDEIELSLRVDFGSSSGPLLLTELLVIGSSYEHRNQNWSQARCIFDARTGVRLVSDAATCHACNRAEQCNARFRACQRRGGNHH